MRQNIRVVESCACVPVSKGVLGFFLRIFQSIFLMSAFMLLFLVEPSGSSFASHVGEEDEMIREGELSTLGVMDLFGKYKKAKSSLMKTALGSQLKALTLKRKGQMLKLLQNRPDAFLKMTLPKNIIKELPSDIQKNLEEDLELEGVLNVFISTEMQALNSIRMHSLSLPNGQEIQLFFAMRPPDLLSGSKVRVRGVKMDLQMALLDGSTSIQSVSAGTLSTANVKKVAVILFNFQNDTSQPWTRDSVKDLTFIAANGVNAYYQEVSFGKMTLEGKLNFDGDIFGWYTLAIDNTTCSYSTWASTARSAAAADGFSTTGYNNVIYAFPKVTACGWSGLGTLGGSPGSSWINGSYNLRVVAHELGHNYALHHSNSYTCMDANGARVAISDTCTSGEYGDPYDVMGSSSKYHFNNFHKGRLNVLDSFNTYDVTVDGTYTIAPIEYASSGIQTLRIPREYDINGNTIKYFYLEFRQPYGSYFDNFSTTSYAVNGVSIRLAPPYSTLVQPQLIDATPETSSFTDAPLAVGKVLSDPVSGVQITTKSVSSSGAQVEVQLAPEPCVLANPMLTVDPVSQWGVAGQSLDYTLKLTNQNSAPCPASDFQITSIVPTGWTPFPVSANMNLQSGESAQVVFGVSSAADAVMGLYDLQFKGMNSADASFQSNVTASYNVTGVDVTPPTVVITSPAGSKLPKGGRITFAGTASDESGIAEMKIYLDSSLLKTCTNSASCSVQVLSKTISRGSHVVRVTAADKASSPNTGEAKKTVTK